MRLFVYPFCPAYVTLPPPSQPPASLHDLRVVERSCGWEGGARQKRVNEKSYLEVERRSISAGWRRDGAEKNTCRHKQQFKGTFLRFSRFATFLFLFRHLHFSFIFLALCSHARKQKREIELFYRERGRFPLEFHGFPFKNPL